MSSFKIYIISMSTILCLYFLAFITNNIELMSVFAVIGIFYNLFIKFKLYKIEKGFKDFAEIKSTFTILDLSSFVLMFCLAYLESYMLGFVLICYMFRENIIKTFKLEVIALMYKQYLEEFENDRHNN